jgi:hypothetical protein
MGTKICNKCKDELPATTEYFWPNSHHKDGLQGHCKKCQNEYRKQWRARYKEKHGESADKRYYSSHLEDSARLNAKRVKEHAEWVDSIKEATPCADCGNFFPAVCVDFDHREGEVKFKGVCWLVQNGYSREKIQEEIDKCDIVCSNCHRIRTHKSGRERPWYDKRRKYDRSTWDD